MLNNQMVFRKAKKKRFDALCSWPKSKAPDTPQTSNATTPSRTGAARLAAAEGVCPCKDQVYENQLLSC